MIRIVVRGSQCLIVLVLAAVVFQASAQPARRLPAQRAADLAALDRFVRDSYAFLPTKATDWNRVISALMPRGRAARDRHSMAARPSKRHSTRYMTAIRS